MERHKIIKIISGGQTGADQGGLQAAVKSLIDVGGHCPLGFLTENGRQESLGTLYNLKETTTAKYPPRTFMNAKEADGTIRFALNFTTAGEILTLSAIKQYKKPYIDVDINKPITPQVVAEWIIENKIKVLNVAGNRETSCPGLQEAVEEFLIEVIQIVNG